MNQAEADIIYLAGLFDGEGSVSLNRYRRNGGNHRCILKIHLSSTDRSVISWLQENFGGSVTIVGAINGHKELHRWSLVSSAASDLLYDMLPYLRIKEEHAFIGIDWQATVKNTGKANGYSREEKEFRDFLYGRLRELNFRGKK